jgi:hypothetical protein
LASAVNALENVAVRKYGTRGVVLWLIGIPWTALGAAFILNPMERFSRPGSGGIGLLDFLDKGPGIYIFSSMWLIGGLAAIAAAITRPRTCNDEWGFVGATVPPFMWGTGYFWSQFAYVISDGEFGRPTAYFALIIYWFVSLLLLFLSKRLQDAPEGPCYRRRK